MVEQQTDPTDEQAEVPEPTRSTWFRIFAGMIERGACSQGVLDGAHSGWRRLDDAEHAELVQMLRDSLTPDPDPTSAGGTP